MSTAQGPRANEGALLLLPRRASAFSTAPIFLVTLPATVGVMQARWRQNDCSNSPEWLTDAKLSPSRGSARRGSA